jgi:hypothetical protein
MLTMPPTSGVVPTPLGVALGSPIHLEIVLEASISVGSGLHQAFLDDLTLGWVGGSILFWRWLSKDKGI